MKIGLALDNDGVFAAFDEHYEALFGVNPNVHGDPLIWDYINADHGKFWGGMPLKAGAMEMWEAFKPFNPRFITGCPKIGYEEAEAHKRVWLKQHFGNVEVVTCLSRDKQVHMRAPGDVLLDDRSSNIKRWVKAGGVGILYRNHEQAIRDVREVLGGSHGN